MILVSLKYLENSIILIIQLSNFKLELRYENTCIRDLVFWMSWEPFMKLTGRPLAVARYIRNCIIILKHHRAVEL